MEYDELKSMWEKYDNKLDNLERLNKKLIRETLLKKPKRKLNWHKFQSIYGLIAVPVILIIAMHPNFKHYNISFIFLLGCILTFGCILYISLLNLKGYLILKQIDLDSDTVIESALKITKFKNLHNSRWKHAILYYPILFIGVILIAWHNFKFDSKTILFLSVLFIITYVINIIAPKMNKDRIARLETDVNNLKEYTD